MHPDETVDTSRRWLISGSSVAVAALAVLWGVALNGPEICGWGGPTLCFGTPRVQLAGAMTIAVVAGVAVVWFLSWLRSRAARMLAVVGSVATLTAAGIGIAAM